MPNPFLATVSGHVSSFIHQFIYSFPTPNVTTSPMGPDEAFQGINAPPGNKSPGQLSLESLLDEPGETRAMAGGVGPLSFAGSGYGLMLVFMVGTDSLHICVYLALLLLTFRRYCSIVYTTLSGDRDLQSRLCRIRPSLRAIIESVDKVNPISDHPVSADEQYLECLCTHLRPVIYVCPV